MEHRCSVRKPFRHQVLLYKNGIPVQAGMCRDLGLGGVFVESTGHHWRKHERLHIELRGADRKLMRLPAVVVHYSPDGAGLMFDALSNEQRRALRALVAKLDTALSASLPPDPRAVA